MSQTAKKTYRGVVKDRQIVLDEVLDLPEGAAVEVRPADPDLGSPRVLLEAIRASPHLSTEEVGELLKSIEEGRRAVRYDQPLR